MANCALPFLTAGSRPAPDCQRQEISPASMNFPEAQSSAFWSVYKPRGTSPPASDSVRGSIVWRRPGRPARQPPYRHTFVASFRHINGRNPGLTWLLLRRPAPFGSGFRPSTNSHPKSGDVLPRTERVILGHG